MDKFQEHLGKDVRACQTQLMGGKTHLLFTDGSQVLVYEGKSFATAEKIQGIFGKMGTVPFNEKNMIALNRILSNT